ncbi:MAG: vWA domain-containing protein [Polyangiaceae bacterium]
MTGRSQRPSTHAFVKALSAGTLAFFAGVLALSCSGKSSDESKVSPCTSQVNCGEQCSVLGTCSSGKYCGANDACTADCVAGDNRCSSSEICNSLGKCENKFDFPSGGGAGGMGSGSGGDGNSPDACVDLKVVFTPQIPTVVMLIDQSGSMNQKFDTGNRWNVLRDALIDMNTGIISTLQAKVRFGLALYTSDGGFGNGQQMKTCPIITPVPPALNNYAAISAVYLPNDWKGDTPTGESVDAAVKILDGVTDEGPKVIVLATDGEPDSCADANPRSTAGLEAARQLSVSAVENAFKKQVTTFVISVGNEVGEAHLRAVANAGQGLAVDVDQMNRFYRANSQAELATAFDTIVSGVRSCVLALNGTVDAASAGTGSVVLDGKALAFDDPNGWKLNSPTVLELQGDACSTIKNGEHDLKISFPCGVIVPTVPK